MITNQEVSHAAPIRPVLTRSNVVSARAPDRVTAPSRIAIVVHGGAGAPAAASDGCDTAAHAGFNELLGGRDGMHAAISAVMLLENDGRFNAGTGAAVGLDGYTLELDAAVMDTRGTLGAVACVRDVKNPVLLARHISLSPAWMLCGEGAQRFAELRGLARHPGACAKAVREHNALLKRLEGNRPVVPGLPNEEFAAAWNYPAAKPLRLASACDTVGAVVRDADGHFAVAASTGGAAPSMLGRVGDVPIIGSGFYAGEHGAVAATGIGEEIVRQLLALTVYRWIEGGMALQAALDRGVALFACDVPVGLIAVSHSASGSASNLPMPSASMEADCGHPRRPQQG